MDLGLSPATVAAARTRFAAQFFPGDTANAAFLRYINEVVERLHENERWIGSLATFRVNVATDKNIYLPYFLDSINSAVIDSHPARVNGPRYEFICDGPGKIEKGSGIAGMIVDAGVFGISADFPVTDADVEIPSTLTISAVSAADAGTAIRILGYDQNGAWIKDTDGTPGERVVLATGAVVTTNQFSGVKGIQKPLTRSAFTVTHTVESKVLASLENWMTNPTFRCYRVLDPSAESVIALCKRKPVPVNYEEDYIFPGVLSALKLGFYGIKYEEEGEINRMQQSFREAVELLNQASAAHKGGAQEQISFEPWGPGISGIRSTN
jgi:hypothetical protein